MAVGKHASHRGFIGVEAVLTLLPLTLFVCFVLELARRPLYEIYAHWASFILAREALILGPQKAQTKARARLKNAFRNLKADGIKAEVKTFSNHFRSRVWIRFPAFARFPWGGKTKHHFEVTEPCTFYFRSY